MCILHVHVRSVTEAADKETEGILKLTIGNQHHPASTSEQLYLSLELAVKAKIVSKCLEVAPSEVLDIESLHTADGQYCKPDQRNLETSSILFRKYQLLFRKISSTISYQHNKCL
jgi:hypothetical protein